MISLRAPLFLWALYILVSPLPAQGQGSAHDDVPFDPLMETQLNRLHMDYRIDDEGDFLVRIHLDNERTQIVYIRSQANQYRDTRVREIFSLARAFHQSIPTPLCEKLLEDSYSSRYTGSWAVTAMEGVYTLTFLTKIPSRVQDEYLLACLMEAALACDEMEQYLGSERDLY